MLNLIIKYLEKLSNFLKNKQIESEKTKKNSLDNQEKENSFSFIKVVLLLFGVLLSLFIFAAVNNLDNQVPLWLLSFSLLLDLFMLFNFVRNLTSRYLFLVQIPLSIWLIAFNMLLSERNIFYVDKYQILLYTFLSIFPLVYILQSYFPYLKNKFVDKIKDASYLYNFWFSFFFALTVLLASFGIIVDIFFPIWDLVEEMPSNDYFYWFFQIITYIFAVFVILDFPIYTSNLYYDNIWTTKRNFYKAMITFLFVYSLWFVPILIDEFYSHQISKANKIINTEWNNYEAYKKAHVLFLERAFLSKIKNWETVDQELFSKLYDNTISWYYWEKVADYIKDRSTFATDSSKIWDKANVVMSLAEIDSKVKQYVWYEDLTIMETTYRFHFTNQTDINQEVKINFETPNKYSVVSWLKLWMDLEYEWQIAPRWAARQVYENSLRRNTDPVLIEKVWLNTYTLRVFPVPSKTGDTQWRQLVEVKILTPLTNENFTYSPKFTVTNLKYDKNSRFQSKIYLEDQLVKEDIQKDQEIEKYVSEFHQTTLKELGIELKNWNNSLCNIESYINITNNIQPHPVKLSNKISLFVDNSLSVEKSKSNNLYQDIYKWIKNFDWKLQDIDLFSYNFDVNKITEIDDINYWWYSDIDRVIDYIINNNITGQRIIILTDSDNFNFSTKENTFRNLRTLVTNEISVIKIWKWIKTYKSDFNIILSATNWNIYDINDKTEISNVVSKILNKKWDDLNKFCEVTTNIQDEINTEKYDETWAVIPQNNDSEKQNMAYTEVEKIKSWYASNRLLQTITDPYTLNQIENKLNIEARKNWIVNQFNSLIAIVTDQQQRELDSYSLSENAYDTTYDNNSWKNSWGSMFWESRRVRVTNSAMVDDFDRWAIRSWWIDYKSSRMNSMWDLSVDTNSSIGFSMSWRTNISLLWILVFIAYLIQFYLFISFIIKYIKWEKSNKESYDELKKVNEFEEVDNNENKNEEVKAEKKVRKRTTKSELEKSNTEEEKPKKVVRKRTTTKKTTTKKEKV